MPSVTSASITSDGAIIRAARFPRDRDFEFKWPVALLLSAAIAAAFVLVPWDGLSGQGFPDRDNYIDAINGYLRGGGHFLDFGSEDLVALLLNEFLWRQALLFIGENFDDPVWGLLLFSFVAVWLTAYQMLRNAGFVYSLIWLICPLSVDLFISQTRSALALGIFVCALPMRKALFRYLLFAFSFFFHTVAAVFVACYLFNRFVVPSKIMSSRLKLVAAVAFGLAASAVWVLFATDIFIAVGNRRGDQIEMQATSIMFAVWWMLVILIFVIAARMNYKPTIGQHVLMGIALLSLFVFGTLLGIGALRFLALSLPFSLIAVKSIRDSAIRVGALLGIVMFNLIHVSYWIR